MNLRTSCLSKKENLVEQNNIRVYSPGGQIHFEPEVDVTQEFVDSEIERVKRLKEAGEELTDFEMDIYLAFVYNEKHNSKLNPYYYCYMRDL